MSKKVLYIDMDNVLVDFKSGISNVPDNILKKYEGRLDEIPGIFAQMQPMKDAIEVVTKLTSIFDTYVLSTSPWLNPTAWHDKLIWIHMYFGDGEDSPLYKRLILSHHKNLNKGNYLVDDREKNGANLFEGMLILFGSNEYPDWNSVYRYLYEVK